MTPTSRHCGGCTLCCKLLPTAEIHKPANTRCQHQRSGKGCAIYDHRPASCRVWSCEWLMKPEATAGLSRPDRVHYVIDIMPDFVDARDEATGGLVRFPVLQIWTDPLFPKAHEDSALRAYLDKRGAEDGMLALIRCGDTEAFLLVPPSVSGKGWLEMHSMLRTATHSRAEISDFMEQVHPQQHAELTQLMLDNDATRQVVRERYGIEYEIKDGVVEHRRPA